MLFRLLLSVTFYLCTICGASAQSADDLGDRGMYGSDGPSHDADKRDVVGRKDDYRADGSRDDDTARGEGGDHSEDGLLDGGSALPHYYGDRFDAGEFGSANFVDSDFRKRMFDD